MRIGELAALLGVSTRTVRHYHHRGVMPEPARRANGYREYGMRDAITLARVRRLVDVGLSLDEIRDVIADDRSRELPEILREIDAGLAAREREIRTARARLAGLLERAASGTLGPDDTASPELVAFLRAVEAPASESAAWDRGFLMVMDAMAPRAAAMLAPPASDSAAMAYANAVYRRLDELADAAPDDPRVEALAAELAEYTARALPDAPGSVRDAEQVEPFLDELAPAQAEVVRQVVRRVAARSSSVPHDD